MASRSTIEKIRKSIFDTIENFEFYKEVDGRNCYMHALKIDMHVDSIFPFSHKFEVGSLSNNFEYIRDNTSLEDALYADMLELGLSCEKETTEKLELTNKNEWKVALYQSSKPIILKGGIPCKCCHLIRQDYNSKKWTQKSGMNSCVTTASRGIKNPKDLKLSFYYNGEKIYYDYVGTYKISTIKEISDKTLEEVRKQIRDIKVKFKGTFNRNCYMYALNVDMDKDKLEKQNLPFIIGGVSNTYHTFDNKDDMIYSFYQDMNILGIDAKKVDSSYKLTSDNEWKVAFYYRKRNDGSYRDFHVIKQIYGDDKWYHKQGCFLKPTYTDDDGKEIINPEDIKLSSDNQKYEYVGTYKLSLK